MRHTSSPLLSHFFCLSYFLISPNSLVWAERSSPHSFDAMESFSRRNQRPEAYEVVYPEPTFEVVEPAKEFKWKDNIPYHKDVPILRNVYEHRAPQEAGILFVNGKQASMMSEDTGTIAHELTHGINSHLEKDNPDFAGFYVPGKGSVLVQKPLARRVHIAPFIPKELRGIDGDGGRFNTYIQDKHGREPDAGSPFVDGTKQVGAANALYPWDEWNSYINGAKAALQAEQKFGKQNSDYLTGPVEFSIYALGSMMATKKLDPEYSRSEAFKQMKKTYAYFASESMKVLKAGRNTSLGDAKGEAYLERFRNSNSAEARAMKEFLVAEFSAGWTEQTFGIRTRPEAERPQLAESPTSDSPASAPAQRPKKFLWLFPWPFRSATP